MKPTEGPKANADCAGGVERGRQFSFLNITEPSQSRQKSFKERVKENAMKDYRHYQRLKRTREYIRTANGITSGKEFRLKELISIADKAAPSLDGILVDSLGIDEYNLPRKFSTAFQPLRKLADEAENSLSSIQSSFSSRISKTNKGNQLQQDLNACDSCGAFPDPQSPLGAGMFDPFDTSPTDGNSSYYYLINHFTGTFAPAFLPIDRGLDQSPVNRLWVRHALNSPILCNAILSCAAVRLDTLYRRKLGPLALHYIGKTIRLLNSALNSPEEFISDQTIAAVALLIANENMTGNIDTIALHMKALKKLVEIRGDLSMLGWNGTLHMFISWQDLISATTTNTLPVFASPKSASPSIIPHPQVSESERSYSFPIITREMPSFSNPRYRHIPDILFQIRHLTLVVESYRCVRGATAFEMLSFSRSRSELECRLLSIRTPTWSAACGQQDYIYEACCVAAIIYMNYVLHEFDPAFGVLRKLKQDVMSIITLGEEMNQRMIGRSEDIALLWINFLGGLLSARQSERRWFAKRIAETVRRLDLRSWEGVEECLMRALWIKRMRDAACEALWAEVQYSLEMMDIACRIGH